MANVQFCKDYNISEEEKDLLDYIVVCISEFSENYNMSIKEAYKYLYQYKGIDFLVEFYDVEHTLSFRDAVDDLTAICKKNGGYELS